MAKLQRDTIPYDQERTIRNFLGSCDFTRLSLPDKMRRELISMLGYKTAPNGALIWRTIECKFRFGYDHSKDWTDTFYSDWETLCEEHDAPVNTDGAANTRTRKPTEGN